jgi:hypothetical protein
MRKATPTITRTARAMTTSKFVRPRRMSRRRMSRGYTLATVVG